MGLRIPQNRIVTSQYTIGGEYILANSYKDYQGYYYETNGNFFAGSEFSTNAPKLLKKDSDQVNQLRLNPATQEYGNLLKTDPLSKNKELKSIPLNLKEGEVKYFAKKLNTNPVKIICISEEDYFENIGKNTLYNFLALKYNVEFGFEYKESNKDIPEIGFFLSDSSDTYQ
jgi:hypothetical protein